MTHPVVKLELSVPDWWPDAADTPTESPAITNKLSLLVLLAVTVSCLWSDPSLWQPNVCRAERQGQTSEAPPLVGLYLPSPLYPVFIFHLIFPDSDVSCYLCTHTHTQAHTQSAYPFFFLDTFCATSFPPLLASFLLRPPSLCCSCCFPPTPLLAFSLIHKHTHTHKHTPTLCLCVLPPSLRPWGSWGRWVRRLTCVTSWPCRRKPTTRRTRRGRTRGLRRCQVTHIYL